MKARTILHCALCAIVCAAAPVAARVTEVNIAAVEPFAEGAGFGDTGAYERVKGTFKGELDPTDARNKVIVNLDKAPRNAAGRVEYEADFYILRPTDPARGSRKILYDVTNRGRQYVHWMFGDSRTPRIKDATFTTPGRLKFPAIPGVQVARRVNEIGVLKDWVKPEMDMSKPYRPLVTQVDADGNEIAGILLPEIAVPLATHTGWNYYRAPHPEGELCDRDGAYVPFAATRADREAKGDPRLSLEERYGDHAAYVKRFEQAANKLITERLLLREDAERLIARARSAETVQRFTR